MYLTTLRFCTAYAARRAVCSAMPELLYVSPHLATRPPSMALARRVKVGFVSAYLLKVRPEPAHTHTRTHTHTHAHTHTHTHTQSHTHTVTHTYAHIQTHT